MSDSKGTKGTRGAKGLVLVVEDERHIAELQRLYLAREGFGVQIESDGEAGLAAARQLRPVAIVLDIGLPGIDGDEICRRLREEGDWTPILLVTARDEEADRVLGLELGADDYITKPFSPRELVARVRTILRRTAGRPEEPVRSVGRVTLDAACRMVRADGRPVELTTTEFNLLHSLLSHPGRVYTRDELLAQVWGYPDQRGTRVVDVYISQLRSKLGDACPIRTVRGVGYSVPDPSA